MSNYLKIIGEEMKKHKVAFHATNETQFKSLSDATDADRAEENKKMDDEISESIEVKYTQLNERSEAFIGETKVEAKAAFSAILGVPVEGDMTPEEVDSVFDLVQFANTEDATIKKYQTDSNEESAGNLVKYNDDLIGDYSFSL